MIYLSKNTINLLAGYGDRDARTIIRIWQEIAFGLVSKNKGQLKHGPIYWDQNKNEQTVEKLKRFT
jgi:hypothetical protein